MSDISVEQTGLSGAASPDDGDPPAAARPAKTECRIAGAGRIRDMKDEAGEEPLQFLTFVLQKGLFAIDITTVREVLDDIRITRVPKSRPHILGVINLRGNVVSVTDLRRCIGMPSLDSPEDGCIIIVDVEENGEIFPLGLLADSVEAVVDLTDRDLSAAPKVGMNLRPEFTSGLAHIEDDYAIILAPDRILLSEELRTL